VATLLAVPLALTALLAAGPAASDEQEVGPRSMAFGGLGSADANVYGELGWIRSGARVDVGITSSFALTVRGEGFLLHHFSQGQNGGALGLRWGSDTGGFLLGALAFEGGVYSGRDPVGTAIVYFLRGEGHLGVNLEQWGIGYLRAALRATDGGESRQSLWQTDGDLGLGWELQRGHWLGGVEGSLWIRPGLAALAQWRIRAGYAF
jgi:hypothetical protein